jgi:hypothetical protein
VFSGNPGIARETVSTSLPRPRFFPASSMIG